MSRESLRLQGYLYQVSFPRSLKTSKCNKIYIMLNFVIKTPEIKVLKNEGMIFELFRNK